MPDGAHEFDAEAFRKKALFIDRRVIAQAIYEVMTTTDQRSREYPDFYFMPTDPFATAYLYRLKHKTSDLELAILCDSGAAAYRLIRNEAYRQFRQSFLGGDKFPKTYSMPCDDEGMQLWREQNTFNVQVFSASLPNQKILNVGFKLDETSPDFCHTFYREQDAVEFLARWFARLMRSLGGACRSPRCASP